MAHSANTADSPRPPTPVSSAGTGLRFLFGATIFLSAFLLFMVQPLQGKVILPWFGGAPMVWTTCLLFYQALLLAGSLYAHALSTLPRRIRAALHVTLIASSLVLMGLLQKAWASPITPGPAWAPDPTAQPVVAILRILLIAIGLPYFILSSTSSLLQACYHRVRPEDRPYGFYALSNAGSLLGLLLYPTVVEPTFRILVQGRLWGGGYTVFAACCAGCVLLAAATRRAGPDCALPERANAGPRATASQMLSWIVLSFAASVFLMATTNQMTADVAPIPFLWVLPLALYLLTFIISFGVRTTRFRVLIALLFLPAALGAAYVVGRPLKIPIAHQILVYASALFLGCLLCHTEVYRRRPHPRQLTLFYLLIATGGVAGGAFAAFLAPVIFSGYWEFHLSLLAACAVAAGVLMRCSKPERRIAWGIPLSAPLIAIVFFLCEDYGRKHANAVLMTRSFYGALRVVCEEVRPGTRIHALMHGSVCHGYQTDLGPTVLEPTAYYGRNSGIGRTMSQLRRQAGPSGLRIGLLGLGVGTLSAYAEPGDEIRFYEINPQVVKIARMTDYFTYLEHCPAEITIRLGDARLSLERELTQHGSCRFDVLAIDVLHGDAIPTHVLTREAFVTYLAHLQRNGVLAFHVTNAHVELAPVLWALRREFALHGVFIETKGNLKTTLDAAWVILSRDRAILQAEPLQAVAVDPSRIRRFPVWTDDFSSLYRALRR